MQYNPLIISFFGLHMFYITLDTICKKSVESAPSEGSAFFKMSWDEKNHLLVVNFINWYQTHKGVAKNHFLNLSLTSLLYEMTCKIQYTSILIR